MKREAIEQTENIQKRYGRLTKIIKHKIEKDGSRTIK